MNTTLTLIALATLFAATSATAAEPTRGTIKPTVAAADAGAKSAPVSQQDRMRLCAKQASGKKGQERKAFMKTCLSKKA